MDYMKSHALIVGGIAVGILLGVWLLGVGINSLRADGGTVGANKDEQTFGSASSPSVVAGCTDSEGVVKCLKRQKMYNASTTLCMFKSPDATSTLSYAGAHYKLASTTATISTWAKGATYSASTTLLANRSTIAANAQLTHVASSTVANAQAGDFNIAPNTFVGLTLQGGENSTDLTGLVPNGFCEVEFIVI